MSESKAPFIPAPPLIEHLFQRIIGPLGATHISLLLIEPDHIEERVLKLVDIFEVYPEYKAPFAALIKALKGGKQESAISLEEQIRFFNTKHTRYWMLVNLLNRVLNLKELALNFTTGRLPARAHDLLKYAHTAKESFGEESRYKDIVFTAGIMFDFLFYLQRTAILENGQSKYDDFLNQCFLKATEQGKRIMKLTKFKNELELEKQAPIAAFMRQLSVVCTVLLKGNEGLEFYKKIEATKPTEPLLIAMQMKQFQVSGPMISSYLAQTFPQVFGKLGDIMAVWGFPYLSWVKGRQNVHDATCMAMLGVGIEERGITSNEFGKIGKPFVEMPELKHLDFTITKEVCVEAKI